MLIVLGVLSILTGGILYLSGNSTNNDLDAQMESIFNDGITNPGSTYENIGLLLVILGVVLVIVGVILKLAKKDDDTFYEKDDLESDEVETLPKVNICSNCGAKTPSDGKFCKECGQSFNVEEESMYCPHCGKQIQKSSKFCMFCGRSINKAGN